MAASETFALVPVDFYDFGTARPDSPLLRILRFGQSARVMRDLHLGMVIYAKTTHAKGFVPDYMVGYIAYPTSQAAARRAVLRLAKAGLVEATAGGYHVPAAEDWPPLQRIGARDPIPGRLRQRVYKRDGYHCVRCGSADGLTLDHIIPWSEFGPDTESNLQTLCGSCNSRKGVRT